MHPGTGRVCVPINPQSLEQFDPLNVPTVQALVKEIDAWNHTAEEAGVDDSDENGDKHVLDWEKTSLKPYIDHFRSFVTTLMKDEIKVKREREEDQAESLDF